MAKKKPEAMTIEELSRQGYLVTKQEVPIDQRIKVDLKAFDGRVFKIGLVSDTHLGSRFQQITHLTSFYNLCAQRGVEVILNAGDVTEGQNMYRGQEFELFCHGADAQADYAVKHYPKVDGVTTYLIAGNHDESHWKTAGIDICRRISQERKDIKYLGMYGAYIKIGGVEIYLHHGGGGVA